MGGLLLAVEIGLVAAAAFWVAAASFPDDRPALRAVAALLWAPTFVLWAVQLSGDVGQFSAGPCAATTTGSTVWCSITPFGLTGPWRERPFNDLVHMALGGIVMMCGYDDHELPPVRPDGGHALAMGGEYAVIGILAALWQRADLGRGQLVDVSIHEAVAGTKSVDDALAAAQAAAEKIQG